MESAVEELGRAATTEDQLLAMSTIAKLVVQAQWFRPQPVALLRQLCLPSRPTSEPEEAQFINRDLERRNAITPLVISHPSLYLVQQEQPELSLTTAALLREPTAQVDPTVLAALLEADRETRRYAFFHLTRDVVDAGLREEVLLSRAIPVIVDGLESEPEAASACLANCVQFEELAQEALDRGALPGAVQLLRESLKRMPLLRDDVAELTERVRGAADAATGAKATLAAAKVAQRSARDAEKPAATAEVTRCRGHLVGVLDELKSAKARLRSALLAVEATHETLAACLRCLTALLERWPRLQAEALSVCGLRPLAAVLVPSYRSQWAYAMRLVGSMIRDNPEAQTAAVEAQIPHSLVFVLENGDGVERQLAMANLFDVIEGHGGACAAVRECGGLGVMLDLVCEPFRHMEVYARPASDVAKMMAEAGEEAPSASRKNSTAAPTNGSGGSRRNSSATDADSAGDEDEGARAAAAAAAAVADEETPLNFNPLLGEEEERLALRPPVHAVSIVAQCGRNDDGACAEILAQAGLGALIDLLLDPNAAVSVATAACLAVLCEDDEVCLRMRQLGGVPPLLAVCVSGEAVFVPATERFAKPGECTMDQRLAAVLHCLALACKSVFEVQDDVRDFDGALESLVNLLVDSSGEVKAKVAVALANVCDGNVANQDELRTHGLFPALVDILLDADDEIEAGRGQAPQELELCTNVARCLSRATVRNSINQLLICRAGGIPALVRLASRGHDSGVVYACEALANCTHDQTECQMALQECNGLRALIDVATFCSHVRARINAVAAIGAACCKFPQHKQLLRLHNGIQPLVSMAVSGSEPEVDAALLALHHILSTSLPNKREVARIGGLRAMIRLAERGSFELQLYAIAFLPSMLETEEGKKRFVHLGGVQPLMPHLRDRVSPVAVQSALRALSHLGLHAVGELLSGQCFPTLVKLLEEERPETVACAATVIAECAFGNREVQQAVIAAKGVKRLMDLSNDAIDEPTRRAVTEAIASFAEDADSDQRFTQGLLASKMVPAASSPLPPLTPSKLMARRAFFVPSSSPSS